MSDPRVPSFIAVGEDDLLLVAHDVQVFEGIRDGGSRATRRAGEATA